LISRTSTLVAAIAGVAFALAPSARAQSTTTNSNPPTGSSADPRNDPRRATEPSAAPNDPNRGGAYDPGRVGTTTRSSDDMNNNRNPAPQDRTSTGTDTGTTTYSSTNTNTDTGTTGSTTYTATSPQTTTTTTDTNLTDTTTNQLPRTGSQLPAAGALGLLAVGGALAARSSRKLLG